MYTVRRSAQTIVILLLAGLMTACGFHIRGSNPASQLPFRSVYLDMRYGTPLERELRGAILSQGGTVLTQNAKEAEATVRILTDTQTRRILTLNAQGQVREVSLVYLIRFDVQETAGKVLLAPREIATEQIMTYSESQALAKESEEKMIYLDLRSDAISQLLRQLAQIKPTE